jgi:hypothetical protein
MNTLKMSFKHRSVLPTEESTVIDLITSNCLIVLGYFLLRMNTTTSSREVQKIKIELPLPQQIESIKQLLSNISNLELIHGVDRGSVIFIGEFDVSDLHDRQILFSRSGIKILDDTFIGSVKDEDSLVEKLEHCEPHEIENLLQDRLSNSYSVCLNAWRMNTWPLHDSLFMPNYEILVPVTAQQVGMKDIKSRITEEFDVLHSEVNNNGQMHFLCYAGEGQYVHTVNDVLRVIEVDYGPDIYKRLERLGIRDFSICFHIDILHG